MLKTYLYEYYRDNYLGTKKESEIKPESGPSIIDAIDDHEDDILEREEGAEVNSHILFLQEKYKGFMVDK